MQYDVVYTPEEEHAIRARLRAHARRDAFSRGERARIFSQRRFDAMRSRAGSTREFLSQRGHD